MAIDLTIEGKTARIVLNRPEVGNALDTDSCRALLDAVHRCEADPAIRVVILTGAGRMFCAGGDVAGFSSAGSDLPRLLRDLTAPLHMAVARLARMPKPVITAVNGAAAGAGLSLALIGDIVLASDAASFSVAYPGVGLSPDGGATFLLPRLMGLRRAQAFILLNRKLSASEALDQGLATFVCPSADLAAETQAMAEQLSAAPTLTPGGPECCWPTVSPPPWKASWKPKRAPSRPAGASLTPWRASPPSSGVAPRCSTATERQGEAA